MQQLSLEALKIDDKWVSCSEKVTLEEVKSFTVSDDYNPQPYNNKLVIGSQD